MPEAVSAVSALSDAQRRERAARTGGEPLLTSETARNAYLDYEQIDTLLSLQRLRSDGAAELSFHIMGQVKELLFKLLHAEFSRARDELAADDPEAALWTLRRALPVQRLLVQVWDVLRAMSPAEFNEFRDALGSASGVQSFMYRRLEFVLGNKSPAMLRPHTGVPAIAEQLAADFAAPSLYDEAVRLLARRGAAIAPEHLAADVAAAYRPHSSVEQAWADCYDRGADPVLRRLAETLADVAYEFSRWRAVHLLIVERTIGDKPGSGASSGLAW
ncbi:tryptophan 2,3-dioxygenase family protein [Dactylosporangium sp. NPDC000555]|uniref:tryptophan 2,3-dioxygenase n=1 Tax=Dactylosporangium sp. NPDC000555 TaxID=3154260 RepID=UPI00332DBD5B